MKSRTSPVSSTLTTKAISSKEDEILTLKSLEVISKIAGMLKTDTGNFVTILENFLALFDEKQDYKMKLKYRLLKEVISNISEADMDELISTKAYFQRIFSQKASKQMLIKETDPQEPLVTGNLSHKESKDVLTKETDLKTSLVTGILPQKKELKYMLIKETDLKIPPVTVKSKGRLNMCVLNMLRQADGTWKKVAIKRAILSENDKFIEREMKVLPQLNHKNIIKFYGKREAKPEIVLEFMDLLDLVDAIMKLNFTTGNLLRILEDVAYGMEYLSEKQYLHRNLTCFNVFLNIKKQCKIGSFGFAVYVGNSNGVYVEEDCSVEICVDGSFISGRGCYRIAIPNLAPETLNNSWTFSTATDVWSMGLLCWDTFALANHCVNLVQLGIVRGSFSSRNIQLPRSQNCPDILYQYVTKNLLNPDPEKRPRFSAISAKIQEIASNVTV